MKLPHGTKALPWHHEALAQARAELSQAILILKQQQAKQSQQWTSVFLTLAAGLGLGCCYLSWHQLRDPLGLRHHDYAYFSEVFSSTLVSFAEVCSGLSFSVIAAVSHTADATIHSKTSALLVAQCLPCSGCRQFLGVLHFGSCTYSK